MCEVAALSQWASLGASVSFDLDNPYSQAWIPQHAGDLVVGISERTRQAIAEVVLRGFTNGMPPREMAREIRNLVGLLPRAQAAVTTYRSKLFIDGYTGDRLDKAVARYAQKLLNQRALLIARTETINAHGQGVLASWRAGQDEGFVLPTAAKKWIAAYGSERTCQICTELHGVIVPLASEFPGGVTAPTRHPACRCSLGLVTMSEEEYARMFANIGKCRAPVHKPICHSHWS